MPLANIQSCHMDPQTTKEGAREFRVTVHSDDGKQHATFHCTDEIEARALRNAIREHATRLVNVADYS